MTSMGFLGAGAASSSHVSGCERVTDSHEKSIDYQALRPTVGLTDWTFPCVDLTDAGLGRLGLLLKSSIQENIEIESLLMQAIKPANWQVKNLGDLFGRNKTLHAGLFDTVARGKSNDFDSDCVVESLLVSELMQCRNFIDREVSLDWPAAIEKNPFVLRGKGLRWRDLAASEARFHFQKSTDSLWWQLKGNFLNWLGRQPVRRKSKASNAADYADELDEVPIGGADAVEQLHLAEIELGRYRQGSGRRPKVEVEHLVSDFGSGREMAAGLRVHVPETVLELEHAFAAFEAPVAYASAPPSERLATLHRSVLASELDAMVGCGADLDEILYEGTISTASESRCKNTAALLDECTKLYEMPFWMVSHRNTLRRDFLILLCGIIKNAQSLKISIDQVSVSRGEGGALLELEGGGRVRVGGVFDAEGGGGTEAVARLGDLSCWSLGVGDVVGDELVAGGVCQKHEEAAAAQVDGDEVLSNVPDEERKFRKGTQTFAKRQQGRQLPSSTAFAAHPPSPRTLALVLSLLEPDPDCDTQFSCTARLLSVSTRPSLSLLTRPTRYHVRQPPRPL
ncbi:hypothetical protein KCU61_g428, partial [Aureobasidium melanogenum]